MANRRRGATSSVAPNTFARTACALLVICFLAVIAIELSWVVSLGLVGASVAASYVSRQRDRARWSSVAAEVGLHVVPHDEDSKRSHLRLHGHLGPFRITVTEDGEEGGPFADFRLHGNKDSLGRLSLAWDDRRKWFLTGRRTCDGMPSELRHPLFDGEDPFCSYATLKGGCITWYVELRETSLFVARVQSTLEVARALSNVQRADEAAATEHERRVAEREEAALEPYRQRQRLAEDFAIRAQALFEKIAPRTFQELPKSLRDLRTSRLPELIGLGAAGGASAKTGSNEALATLREMLDEQEARLASQRLQDWEIEDN